jgi:aryl-alcohol dehydrogenase-like predicted oxidoreductase
MQALVLGTAQWGEPYGVTNALGRLNDEQIQGIARVALDRGIKEIDTAAGYGDAEARIAPWAASFGITTKVKGQDELSVVDQLSRSLECLGLEAVRVCLIHDWSTLSDDAARIAVRDLTELKARGIVEKIGISGYDTADLARAIAIFNQVDCVQMPVNLLDRRLAGTKEVAHLHEVGCEVQARSVFLQGVLAAASTTPIGQHPDVVRFHAWCVQEQVSPLQVALQFVRELTWVDKVVVGATSGDELNEVCAAWDAEEQCDLGRIEQSTDMNLIDPRNWSAIPKGDAK